MITLPSLCRDAWHLFFPHICCGCGDDNIEQSQLICANCYNELPRTLFANIPENTIEKIFYGRLNLDAAHSEFYFSKGQLVQRLIHELKYKGNKELGIFLGQVMGETLLNSNRFSGIDVIIPLPMFGDKIKKRGYNQAEIIALGVAEKMKIPISSNNLKRNRSTSTQTRKHRTERWQNVDQSFIVVDEAALTGKSILLIDDVITTGATLDACGQAILKIPGTKLSLSTVAQATH